MKFLNDVIDMTGVLSQHPKVLKFKVAGSALYHPDPQDLDFLVLVNGNTFLGNADSFAARWMFGPEWEVCAGQYDDQTDKWGALRKGNVNLSVTVDPAWYERAVLANEVCHALKLMDKADRIVTYRVIRDGYNADEANKRRDGRS